MHFLIVHSLKPKLCTIDHNRQDAPIFLEERIENNVQVYGLIVTSKMVAIRTTPTLLTIPKKKERTRRCLLSIELTKKERELIDNINRMTRRTYSNMYPVNVDNSQSVSFFFNIGYLLLFLHKIIHPSIHPSSYVI